MARPKKDYKIFSMKLSTPIYDRLTQFCEETGMQKTSVVEKTLEKLFDDYFSKKEEERKLI